MTNIIMLHEGEMPTLEETYRAFKYLENKKLILLSKANSFSIKESQLNSCDIVFCVRGHSPITYYILKKAKKYGKKIYYFLDDDLKDMPKGSFWYPERKKWLLNCISLSDILFTDNKLIAEEYENITFGKKTVIINTAINIECIIPYEQHNDKTKIVMASSEWHSQNFIKYVKNAAIKISEEYKDKIEWYFVGLHPNFNEINGISKVEYIPSMQMGDYIEYMKTNRFDIGIAVLAPDHFSERKYFNKFIEYTRYGICGIYSNCMPFKLVVKNEENGIYAENTDDGWYNAFKKLIDNKNLIKSCVENAQQYLKDYHAENKIFDKLIADCPDLVNYHSDKTKKISKSSRFYWRMRHRVFRFCESIYLTFSSLSHYGMKETLFKIKRKLKF